MFLILVGAIFLCLVVSKLQLLMPLSVLSSIGANKNGQRGHKNFYPHFLELPFKNKASKRKKDLSLFVLAHSLVSRTHRLPLSDTSNQKRCILRIKEFLNMKHVEGYRCIKLYCYVFVLINFLRRLLSIILGDEHRDISNAD